MPRPEPAESERSGLLHVLRHVLHGAGRDAGGPALRPPLPRRHIRPGAPHGAASILCVCKVFSFEFVFPEYLDQDLFSDKYFKIFEIYFLSSLKNQFDELPAARQCHLHKCDQTSPLCNQVLSFGVFLWCQT